MYVFAFGVLLIALALVSITWDRIQASRAGWNERLAEALEQRSPMSELKRQL